MTILARLQHMRSLVSQKYQKLLILLKNTVKPGKVYGVNMKAT